MSTLSQDNTGCGRNDPWLVDLIWTGRTTKKQSFLMGTSYVDRTHDLGFPGNDDSCPDKAL